MNRPEDIFPLSKSRLRNNPKFRALRPSEKWYWIELCLFLDDQGQEKGVCRWPLERIARSLNAPLDVYQSLIKQECLKGADEGQQCEAYVHVNRRGEQVILIPAQMGPIWYSSAIVRDDYLRLVASKSGKRGGGNPVLRAKNKGDSATLKGADKGVVKGADKGMAGNPSPSSSLSPTPPISNTTPNPEPAGAGCSEASSEPELLAFPCLAGKAGKPTRWALVQSFVSDLAAAFPGVDILTECRKARVWIDANPANRKTHDGMKDFLLRWLNKAQNQARARGMTYAKPANQFQGARREIPTL